MSTHDQPQPTPPGAEQYLTQCLYFTVGALQRELTTLADRYFSPTGLTPSQGFALLCIVSDPDITPSTIANHLALAPSTVSRIIDALVRKNLVTDERIGRTVQIRPTDLGLDAAHRVETAWKDLYDHYSQTLGQPHADTLCAKIHQTSIDLKNDTHNQ